MKKMISDMKANERVMTFLGVSSRHSKISRNGKGYLEIEFYDISGRIRGYLFGDPENSNDIRKCLYAEVTALTKLNRGSLILQVNKIRVATPDEFVMEDIYQKPRKEEMERMITKMFPSGMGTPKISNR